MNTFAKTFKITNVFLTLFENVTIFAKSILILMQFENFCTSLHVSDSAQKKMQLWTLWIFLEHKISSWENVEVMFAFGELLEAHFRAPKKCKSWALVRTRAQCSQCSRTFFLHFFLRKILKNVKIKLSPAPELNFCGPVPLKNQFSALALSFAILWILPHPNRIWGGTCGPKRCAQHLIGV